MTEQHQSGVVDVVFESARTGVQAAGAVVNEGIGGAGDVANTVVDLGQGYAGLLAEGAQMTVKQATDLAAHLLDRAHAAVMGT